MEIIKDLLCTIFMLLILSSLLILCNMVINQTEPQIEDESFIKMEQNLYETKVNKDDL